jgi:large subunit ribosomal protein L32e
MTEEENGIKEIQSSKKGYKRHKKPKFLRQESWRYKRVGNKWRKPHGIDSKMRKKIKGWPMCPTTGYRSPKKTRGLHPSGFVEVRVESIEDLGAVDPELQAIRVGRTVGGRKRVEILTLAEERGIYILNPRAIKETEEFIDENLESQSDGEKKD